MATVDDKKIIFSMVGLNKTIQQNNKQVLKNIYLSFFYGAKIGIIGLNGSGNSTLLKIIAGLDKVMEQVWNYGYVGDDQRTVDVTVRRLREKIEENPASPKYILTRRGVGYYFAV